ncbi:hypothetical protein [Protofrankia symbiont of Coriaria ruscifolia]|uniref:hypothetical protein n=1 Tax=Protofrankia symbiont of Coriaria ruscifolia TaxID=1306542 RepID=UPI001041A9AE|nr:hypothetical protein [Protofrankia symbiont of Coriaria ruscifolia]
MSAAGGRWPRIADGVKRDHRCFLLYLHLMHALHGIPWKSCCVLTPDDPGYDTEKRSIERQFSGAGKNDNGGGSGGKKMRWSTVAAYLEKLPEESRSEATAISFALFRAWCEGTRGQQGRVQAEEAKEALNDAMTAVAALEYSLPAVSTLWTGGCVAVTPPSDSVNGGDTGLPRPCRPPP